MKIKSRKNTNRVRTKLSGGRVSLSGERVRPSKHLCSSCGKVLNIPYAKNSIIKKLPKSQKKSHRKFGGNMCSACSRKILKDQANELKL